MTESRNKTPSTDQVEDNKAGTAQPAEKSRAFNNDTNVRRRRKALAHLLRLIASLRARNDELQAENTQLENIIAAQAEHIRQLLSGQQGE